MPIETIYVYLPHEPVAVWAPVDAEQVDGWIYRIVDCRNEDDEVEFAKGSLVRCQLRLLREGIEPEALKLVAVERIG